MIVRDQDGLWERRINLFIVQAVGRSQRNLYHRHGGNKRLNKETVVRARKRYKGKGNYSKNTMNFLRF